MNTRRTWWRGTALAALVVALAAVGASSAGAKPKAAFAPKTGSYEGKGNFGAEQPNEVARLVKSGSAYSLEVGLDAPAECEDKALGASVPELLTIKVKVPVKGKTFSFKGKAPVRSVLEGQSAEVTLSGHFTGESAFTATVKSSVSVEAGNPSSTSCTIPTGTLTMKAGA